MRKKALSLAGVMTLAIQVSTSASGDRIWTVPCGMPKEDTPFITLMTRSIPWELGGGHIQAKVLPQRHPEGIRTEMWILSQNIGWWMFKGIRVHPDDSDKLDLENLDPANVRQIIESPFLQEPVVILGEIQEETVNGQLLALLPVASSLRCDTETGNESK